MIRAVLLALLLGGLAYWLQQEQSKGKFHTLNRTFLEVLLGAARDRFVPASIPSIPVTCLPILAADKDEYATWPPSPVDYQMIAQGLKGYAPSLVLITDSLRWSESSPPLISGLAEALLPLQPVLFAQGSATEPTTASPSLPPSLTVDGDTSRLPSIDQVATPQSELGPYGSIVAMAMFPVDSNVPLLFKHKTEIIPSAALEAMLHAVNMPTSEVRITLGGGSAIYLGSSYYLPIHDDGTLAVTSSMSAGEQNALDLMTAGMVDGVASDLEKKMSRGAVVVLGQEDHGTRQIAGALAQLLALPKVQSLGTLWQWATWLISAVLGMSLLKLKKEKALRRALLYLLLALVASGLAFQMRMIWFPPAIPALLLLAAGVFVRLFGKSTVVEEVTSHG